jgi:hypothetical protein
MDRLEPALQRRVLFQVIAVDGHVWLMPYNPAFQPIPADDATILGRVVAVVRPALSRPGRPRA